MKQTQRHNNKAQNKVNISFANEWSKTNGFFIFVLQISGALDARCVCVLFHFASSFGAFVIRVVCGIVAVVLIL